MSKGCLCIHGFTGGPFELAPLARHLERAGWRCAVPTLPGHDHPDRLRSVRWDEWIRAADEWGRDVAQKHGPFDLVGFSMGGLLAAHVAARHPVRRLVLLNAAVIYVSPGRFLRDAASALKEKDWSRVGKVRETPLRATWQFMRVVRSAKSLWRSIRVPTLIVQSGRDPVVHPFSARYLAMRIPAPKRVVYFPQSKHLICLDVEAERLFRTVEQFLNEPESSLSPS